MVSKYYSLKIFCQEIGSAFSCCVLQLHEAALFRNETAHEKHMIKCFPQCFLSYHPFYCIHWKRKQCLTPSSFFGFAMYILKIFGEESRYLTCT